MQQHRELRYKLSHEEFLEFVDKQDNCCAICLREFSEAFPVCVDHNHETGDVRGLLCKACNTAIGFLQDDPAAARAAAEYLRRN